MFSLKSRFQRRWRVVGRFAIALSSCAKEARGCERGRTHARTHKCGSRLTRLAQQTFISSSDCRLPWLADGNRCTNVTRKRATSPLERSAVVTSRAAAATNANLWLSIRANERSIECSSAILSRRQFRALIFRFFARCFCGNLRAQLTLARATGTRSLFFGCGAFGERVLCPQYWRTLIANCEPSAIMKQYCSLADVKADSRPINIIVADDQQHESTSRLSAAARGFLPCRGCGRRTAAIDGVSRQRQHAFGARASLLTHNDGDDDRRHASPRLHGLSGR